MGASVLSRALRKPPTPLLEKKGGWVGIWRTQLGVDGAVWAGFGHVAAVVS